MISVMELFSKPLHDEGDKIIDCGNCKKREKDKKARVGTKIFPCTDKRTRESKKRKDCEKRLIMVKVELLFLVSRVRGYVHMRILRILAKD